MSARSATRRSTSHSAGAIGEHGRISRRDEFSDVFVRSRTNTSKYGCCRDNQSVVRTAKNAANRPFRAEARDVAGIVHGTTPLGINIEQLRRAGLKVPDVGVESVGDRVGTRLVAAALERHKPAVRVITGVSEKVLLGKLPKLVLADECVGRVAGIPHMNTRIGRATDPPFGPVNNEPPSGVISGPKKSSE